MPEVHTPASHLYSNIYSFWIWQNLSLYLKLIRLLGVLCWARHYLGLPSLHLEYPERARSLLNQFSRNPPPLVPDYPKYLIKFLTPPFSVSYHWGLLSISSKNLLYPWCFLKLTFNPLIPTSLLSYKSPLILVGIGVESLPYYKTPWQ